MGNFQAVESKNEFESVRKLSSNNKSHHFQRLPFHYQGVERWCIMMMPSMDLHVLGRWRSQYCTNLSLSGTMSGTWCCSSHRLGRFSSPVNRKKEVLIVLWWWKLPLNCSRTRTKKAFINEFFVCVIFFSFITVEEMFTLTKPRRPSKNLFRDHINYRVPFLFRLLFLFRRRPNSFPLLFLLISFPTSYFLCTSHPRTRCTWCNFNLSTYNEADQQTAKTRSKDGNKVCLVAKWTMFSLSHSLFP